MGKNLSQHIYEETVSKIKELCNVYCCPDIDMIMHYGPAHIVWDDGNFDDESIKFCMSESYKAVDMPWEIRNILILSLNCLLQIPFEDR